jgi:hypothetical protein
LGFAISLVDKGALWATPSEGEESALTVAADEGGLLATSECAEAHHVVCDKAEDAVVVGLGGVLAELNEAFFTPCCLLGDLSDAAHGGLGRQVEDPAGVGVQELVRIVLARKASRKAKLRNLVAGSMAAFERMAKRLRLCCRRLELEIHNELPASSIEMLLVCSTKQRPTPHPAVNGGVSGADNF